MSEPEKQAETGRDPETGRFLPGVSGNPHGRPRGYDFQAIALERAKAKGETIEQVVGELIEDLRVAARVPASASAACKVLLDRLCGPVLQQVEHSGGVQITLDTGIRREAEDAT